MREKFYVEFNFGGFQECILTDSTVTDLPKPKSLIKVLVKKTALLLVRLTIIVPIHIKGARNSELCAAIKEL